MIESRVALASPRFFRFDFPNDVETVLVVLLSSDDYCMTLSIQKPQCPVFDEESNIRYTGYWQTFRKKAGITIEVGGNQLCSINFFVRSENNIFIGYLLRKRTSPVGFTL